MSDYQTDKLGVWFKSRMSAQVRARLLFDREIDIDAAHNVGIASNEFLEKLAKQKFELEKQRNSLISGIFILTFAVFFAANGKDFKVPGLEITLSSVPGVHSLIGLAAAFFILFAQIAGINIGAYSGLMEAISKKRSANTLVDPDIISASVIPFQMIFKILNPNFNTYHVVHIVPQWLGALFYRVSMGLLSLLLLGCVLLIMSYTAYFLAAHVPNTVFGIAAKIAGFTALACTLLLNLAADFEFSQRSYVQITGTGKIENSDESDRQA